MRSISYICYKKISIFLQKHSKEYKNISDIANQ